MSISHATVTLTSTTLASNSAHYGGGMYIYMEIAVMSPLCDSAASSPTQLKSGQYGHAIYIYKSPTIAAINTYFSNPIFIDSREGLQRVRHPACARKHHGLESSADLALADEEDLEEAGLSTFQKKKLRRALKKKGGRE